MEPLKPSHTRSISLEEKHRLLPRQRQRWPQRLSSGSTCHNISCRATRGRRSTVPTHQERGATGQHRCIVGNSMVQCCVERTKKCCTFFGSVCWLTVGGGWGGACQVNQRERDSVGGGCVCVCGGGGSLKNTQCSLISPTVGGGGGEGMLS